MTLIIDDYDCILRSQRKAGSPQVYAGSLYAKKAKPLFYTEVGRKRNLAVSSPVASNSVPRNRLQHWDRQSAKGAIHLLGRQLDVAVEPPRHQRHQSADNVLCRSLTTLG